MLNVALNVALNQYADEKIKSIDAYFFICSVNPHKKTLQRKLCSKCNVSV